MTKLTKHTLEEYFRQCPTQETNYIKVVISTCSIAAGAEDVFQILDNEVKVKNYPLKVIKTGCLGLCHAEPIIEVKIEDNPVVYYKQLNTKNALGVLESIVNKTAEYQAQVINENLKQKKIVLRNCGIVDPENLENCLCHNSYQALSKALFEQEQNSVLEDIKISGLRGRGGAGFPTWKKWLFSKEVESGIKYIICNGDEGDPGAYMDRSILECDPHSVIEGMMIAGYVVGATNGVFYIRAEYPLAVERVQKALKQCYEFGLLGKNILGSDFSFDIEVRLGAGAFVCGEETALIASIEGKRGYPRPRPPFPAVQGLWGKPTVINNVETLANVPYIILNGGKKFASIGTEQSKGTKVFALTGKVKHSSLAEVPMGTTLREMIFDIGGGVSGENPIKAVQTGGPSGGLIPAKFLDTPISYESLQSLGSIMGSGGMIVMDESDCVVDIAKFFLKFCVDESCGKCAPCRVGSTQLLKILEKITDAKGELEDIEKLKRISNAMKKASLCGLGQTASNPIVSGLMYFEEEYLEHINQKKCRAGSCKALKSDIEVGG